MTTNGVKSFHIKTPLLDSIPLSKLAGSPVLLKCENCQPSGSFKLRGIGYKVQKEYESGCRNIVVASGGNAGLATAYSANKLGMDATVVISETSPNEIAKKLIDLGAKVLVHGKDFDETNELALKIGAEPGNTYLHPFDDPVIWEGHTSMIKEIQDELNGEKPRCLVVAVGGGGLLVGVIQGLKKYGWGDVPVVAMETVGADCYNAAVKAGKLVSLPCITSICHCLAAKTACKRSLEYKINDEHPIFSKLVSDEEALDACYQFLDHHRFMVEPACGAGLAAIYSGIIKQLQSEGAFLNSGPVVAIVCGGAGSTLEQLNQWKAELAHKHSSN